MLPEGKENTSFDDHKFARGKPINGKDWRDSSQPGVPYLVA